jgi:hypothetical protein
VIEIAELERVYGSVDIETLAEPVQIGHYGTPKRDNSDSALVKEIELYANGWPTKEDGQRDKRLAPEPSA